MTREDDDKNGVRGDQPGFNKHDVAVYGIGVLNSDDFIGQTTWSDLTPTTGWTWGNKAEWPTQINYDSPQFVETMDWIKSLAADGYMATGTAPTPIGPDGTRKVMSNSNGNNIWAGTKNPQLTWKWVSYMGSAQCQTMAAEKNGSFFPSIPSAMDAMSTALAKQGVNLNVFTQYEEQGSLYGEPVSGRAAMRLGTSAVRPESRTMLAATARAVVAVSPIPAQPARSITLPPIAVPTLPPMKYTTM